MIEENHIDDLFDASLNGLNIKPSMSAWDKLSQELDAIDSASVSFDEQANNIMRDFKVSPSNTVWSNLDSHLAAASAAAVSFDNHAAESMANSSHQPSAKVWENIKTKLDEIETANYQFRRQFALWFAISTSVAAALIFFFMHFPPDFYFNKINENNISPFVRVNTSNSDSSLESTNTNNITNNFNNSKVNNSVLSTESISSKNQVNRLSAEPVNIKTKDNNANKSHSISTRDIIAENNEKSILSDNDDEKIIEEIISIQEFKIENVSPKTISKIEGLSPLDLASKSSIHLKSLRAATGLSIDLFAGPELIINTINQKSSVGDQAILEEVQPVCTDITLGANLKFHYNNFFIQSGLTYSNYGDKRIYQKNTELHDTSGSYYSYNINSYITYDTIGWVDDPLEPGGVIPQLSATFHSDTIGRTWNSVDSIYYNVEKYALNSRYRYIEIPIMLGYRVNYKNWGIYAAAGLSYGFKVAEQGKYINNGNLRTIYSANSPYSDFTTNGIISLGISYSITNKISLILQPTYKTNLKELNNLSASYRNVSMRMGVNILL